MTLAFALLLEAWCWADRLLECLLPAKTTDFRSSPGCSSLRPKT